MGARDGILLPAVRVLQTEFKNRNALILQGKQKGDIFGITMGTGKGTLMLDLEDTRFAEPAFFFVQRPEVFADFCRRCEVEDLSVMEYIARYRRAQFEEWTRAEYPQLLPPNALRE